MKILVVEDRQETQESLEAFLRLSGCWTDRAGNGVEALKRLAVSVPDAVVCDFFMPLMDGLTLAQALRCDTRYQSLPIAIISGIPEADVGGLREEVEHIDKAIFFHKPFDVHDLMRWLVAITGMLADVRPVKESV